jgi:peptidoglycan/xylan/chitin deacetylase (PgdA/CDA1 family)
MRSWREIAAGILTVDPVLGPLQRLSGGGRLTCLTYHRIGNFDRFDPDGPNTCASFADLEWQISWLHEHVRVLDSSEMLAYIQGRANFDKPAVCLTFDDGYAESLRIAEILARHRVPALFFIVSDFVGDRLLPDWYRIAYAVRSARRPRLELLRRMDGLPASISLTDRDAALRLVNAAHDRLRPSEQGELAAMVEEAADARALDHVKKVPRYIDWAAVRALHALGHTIGAHTRTHPILSRLSPEDQRVELESCRGRIQDELGAPVTLLAYPYGGRDSFDDETKRLATAAGYQAAFSCYGGKNRFGAIDPFNVCRTGVAKSRAMFRLRAALPAFGRRG